MTAGQADDDAEPGAVTGRLARALKDAVVLGDSHGDVDQAAKILDGAVRRHSDGAPPAERVKALAYLLELTVRRGDATGAREALARIDALDLSVADRTAAAGALASVAELRTATGDLDAGPSAPSVRPAGGEPGGATMPLYLTRFSYTPETWARMIANPEDRRKAAANYIESVGGKLHGFWYAFGAYDGINLWEAPETCRWPRWRWRSAAAGRSAPSRRPSS